MAFQIAAVSQSLNTAEEMRTQTQIIMKPYVSWDKYLTPAPLSIAIMAELACLSSNADFSINRNPPAGGYKYLQHTDSFGACLMQVCNSSWWAFSKAHKNMDQIRLHTLTVPNYMKNAIKILLQGSDNVIQAHLPQQLQGVRSIADDCLVLANETEASFSDVIKLIHELLEACQKTGKLYGDELEEIKRRIKESELRQESSNQAVLNSQKAVESMEEKVKEALESYNAAMKSLPGGWEMIGMDFVGALGESVASLIQGVTSLVTKPVSLLRNAKQFISETIRGETTNADPVAEINIYSLSSEILTCAEHIMQIVQDNKIDWSSLYDQKKAAPETDFQKEQFERILTSLEKNPNCPPKDWAQKLCTEGISICKELAKYAPHGRCEEVTTEALIQKIQQLGKEACRFDSKSKDVNKFPSLTPKAPMMFMQERQEGNMSASQKASNNARFRIEQSRAQMEKTRQLYDRYAENLEKNQKELNETLTTLRNCQIKEIDFQTTIDMLLHGLEAMGKVKKQWENMVHFFQMVSGIVKCSLNTSLHDFAKTSENTQALAYTDKLFCKDLLYNQAFQATNIANLVHMIASTYTEVSSEYLMDSVSSLGTLLCMNKKSPELLQMRNKLRESCDTAQKQIVCFVRKNKQEFENMTDSRLKTIESQLLPILSAAKPEEIRIIRETARSGFTDEDVSPYI